MYLNIHNKRVNLWGWEKGVNNFLYWKFQWASFFFFFLAEVGGVLHVWWHLFQVCYTVLCAYARVQLEQHIWLQIWLRAHFFQTRNPPYLMFSGLLSWILLHTHTQSASIPNMTHPLLLFWTDIISI